MMSELLEKKEFFQVDVDFSDNNAINLITDIITYLGDYQLKKLLKEFNLDSNEVKLEIALIPDCYEVTAGQNKEDGTYKIRVCRGLVEFYFKLLRFFFILFKIDINNQKNEIYEDCPLDSLKKTAINIGSAYWKKEFLNISVFPELKIENKQLDLFINLFYSGLSFFISHELGHIFIQDLNLDYKKNKIVKETKSLKMLKIFEETKNYKLMLIGKWKNELKADNFGFLSNQEKSSVFSLGIIFYFLFLKFCEQYFEKNYFKIRLNNWLSHPPTDLKLKNLFKLKKKIDRKHIKILEYLETSISEFFEKIFEKSDIT